MTTYTLQDFLQSNWVKDGPKVRLAEFDLIQLQKLSETDRKQVELILLSRLKAGSDPRPLVALAEIGTDKAIEPLMSYRDEIRERTGSINRDGLLLQILNTIWRIAGNSDLVIADAIQLVHDGRFGNVRAEAAAFLGKFNNTESREALLIAIEDPLAMVRTQAATALLRQMQPSEDYSTLIQSLAVGAEERQSAIEQIRALILSRNSDSEQA